MHWPLIRNLPREFHFDFVKLAPYAAILSAILIALSGVSFFTKGLNLGIDFIGGSLIEVQTKGPADIGLLRSTMTGVGGEDAQVQQLGTENGAMLRFRTAEGVNAVDGAERARAQAVAGRGDRQAGERPRRPVNNTHPGGAIAVLGDEKHRHQDPVGLRQVQGVAHQAGDAQHHADAGGIAQRGRF